MTVTGTHLRERAGGPADNLGYDRQRDAGGDHATHRGVPEVMEANPDQAGRKLINLEVAIGTTVARLRFLAVDENAAVAIRATAKGPILNQDDSQRDGLEGFALPRRSASQVE